MRILGYLFVLVLLIAAVGYFRGWFSVTTTQAGGKSEVTLGVDGNKIGDDANAAAAGLGKLSKEATEAVKSDASEIEGTLTAVDLARRDITVSVGSQSIDFQVPAAVPINSDGKGVGFEDLRTDTRVRLSFEHAGDDRVLARIEILR